MSVYRKYLIAASIAPILLMNIGCASQKEVVLTQYFRQSRNLIKSAPPVSERNVSGLNLNKGNVASEISDLESKGYVRTGVIAMCGPIVSQLAIKENVAKLGFDYYIASAEYDSKGIGTRMVPVGYIGGSSVTTSSQGYGFSNNENYGNYTSGSQSYISGSTIYGREKYEYNKYHQEIYTFVSPRLRLKLVAKGILPDEPVKTNSESIQNRDGNAVSSGVESL
jgi:hypothetical protein